jgi:protein gp37
VFPSSIDWLDEDVPVELLARFLQLIQATPYLKWLLLTKRPELWVERLNKPSLAVLGYKTFIMLGDWIGGSAPANVWLGASVEDQTRADERIPALLKIPAVGRFLSVEPLLGQVRLASIPYEDGPWDGGTRLMCNPLTGWRATSPYSADNNGPRIHWVIIGGESGPGARPCNVDWIRSIVGQCRAAHVAPFVKQLGSRPIGHHNERLAGWPELHLKDNPIVQWKLNHPKGGDPAEWPLDLQGVREFPEGLR